MYLLETQDKEGTPCGLQNNVNPRMTSIRIAHRELYTQEDPVGPCFTQKGVPGRSCSHGKARRTLFSAIRTTRKLSFPGRFRCRLLSNRSRTF